MEKGYTIAVGFVKKVHNRGFPPNCLNPKPNDTSIYNHTDEAISTEQNLHTIAQEAYMINCESTNYELKEDETDYFNAETFSQRGTKPDECWDHPRKNTGGN